MEIVFKTKVDSQKKNISEDSPPWYIIDTSKIFSFCIMNKL